MKLKVGSLGRFPPEDSPIATYTKNLDASLSEKCDVVTIGLGNSDCDYKIEIDKKFKINLSRIVENEELNILHIQYITSSRHFVQNSKFAVINYYNTILANVRLLQAMDALNIPKIVTLHELNIQSKNAKKVIVKILERQMIKKSDKVIVHSPLQKSILTEQGIDAECIHFGLTPVKISRSGGKNILYMGTFHPDRGVEYLVRAMKFLPEYTLTVMGAVADESYASNIKNEIKEMNLKNVTLRFGWGTLNDRDKLYRWADIAVLPYLWAPNQSAALHNALAYRIPVVVTNTNGPIDETVKEFSCGIVVDMKDSKSLADGIEAVHEKYNHYIKNVDAYRKIADWGKVADEHIELYNKAIKDGVKQ